MKARDRVAVSALRATLATLDNAEAVDHDAAARMPLAIELTPVGVGAADVERRVLTDAEVAHIVGTEVAEREAAAEEYERAGRVERAELLRAEARVLSGDRRSDRRTEGHGVYRRLRTRRRAGV